MLSYKMKSIKMTKKLQLFSNRMDPTHTDIKVEHAVNAMFANWQLRRCGPQTWISRIFTWWYVSNVLYAKKTCDLCHLRDRIYTAVVIITLDILRHMWDENDYWLNICRATNIPHIHTYLRCQETLTASANYKKSALSVLCFKTSCIFSIGSWFLIP
jgi:hypothetical protein